MHRNQAYVGRKQQRERMRTPQPITQQLVMEILTQSQFEAYFAGRRRPRIPENKRTMHPSGRSCWYQLTEAARAGEWKERDVLSRKVSLSLEDVFTS